MKNNSFVITRKRLLIAILSITFLFSALFCRLFYLQVCSSGELTARAAEQWYRDLPLAAARGNIYDTNGEVIVDSKDVFTVYLRPAAVTDKTAVKNALVEILGLTDSEADAKLSKKASEVTVKKNVDFSSGAKLRDMSLDGIYFSVDSARSYPYSEYLAQVIGYTNVDGVGQNGLEGYYDKYLSGVDGMSLTATDNKGVEIGESTTYVPAIDGASLKTTLDINIQAFAETAVESAMARWNAKSSSMIVMDVETGSILAMAKAPSYSLNDLPRNDVYMLNAYSKNTMIVDVYEPGSTFKIFTTAAAIEEGLVSDNSGFYCPGYRMVDGQKIKCWRSIGHGSQNLVDGVKNSCNCVFMDLARSLGTEKLYEYLHKFGFGSKTGVDFYSESSGILMSESKVKTVDLARMGFGQAVAVTPLQLITAVSSVVNGGEKVTPHFVESIVDYSGNTVYEFRQSKTRVISSESSKKIRSLLSAVVEDGGGKKAAVSGYSVGGKTGTAQKYENGTIAHGKYVSSFVGFAPADNPKYAVLIIVDEPNSDAYYGSIVAAPYAGEVFQKIFEYKRITPAPTLDEEFVLMPNVEGKDVFDAVMTIESAGFRCEIAGDGSRIVTTLPIAGEKVKKGDVVLLRSA